MRIPGAKYTEGNWRTDERIGHAGGLDVRDVILSTQLGGDDARIAVISRNGVETPEESSANAKLIVNAARTTEALYEVTCKIADYAEILILGEREWRNQGDEAAIFLADAILQKLAMMNDILKTGITALEQAVPGFIMESKNEANPM